ncbi:tetratricopeptide repeat protein 31-like isoform X1 [Coregonus clupeaformis]|uniref:tetratricopeptide repeat protein 31-like isoform X1 n=1 Tax=Coregonus clupeaformis TaxID=59861 RepID=UPI001E1C53DF|nr:tetratricopeptide repeat protein 31-like isoform X1 [Coregonus clupeaformis]
MSERRLVKVTEVEPDPGDIHMMNAVMDFVRGNSHGLNVGFLGLDFVTHEYYTGEDCYDDGNYEDHHGRKSYCGFSRNFLAKPSPSNQPTSVRYNQPPKAPSKPSPVNHAEKAAELLEEKRKSKLKAEKKRMKKIKQRERRLLEKLEKEKQNPVKEVKLDAEESKGKEKCNKTGTSAKGTLAQGMQDLSVTDSGDSSGESSDDEDSEEESNSDELQLDMTSSFVSKAAEIAKRQLEQKPEWKVKNKCQTKEKPNDERKDVQKKSPVPNTEDIVKRSTELAVIGNQFASGGHFDMAVKYFTDAIKYNPAEFRLFGNRSFCYEKMQEYEKALADAELALNMSPGWVKGLYRKGRALAGLKRYDEAAQALKEVLQLDGYCADAAQELMRVQITQLMEFGFSREQSSNALIIHGTVEKSLEALSKISGILYNGRYPTASVAHPAKVDSAYSVSRTSAFPSDPKPRQAQHSPSLQDKPKSNTPAMTMSENFSVETKLYPIWVGNLVPSGTEAMIKEIFEGAGKIHSIKLLRARRCAFINYFDPECCEIALKFHGMEINGTKISVRYPDRNPTHLGIAKDAQKAVDLPSNSTKECFFWRNQGCDRRPNCPYRHIQTHKGVDRGKGKTSAQ